MNNEYDWRWTVQLSIERGNLYKRQGCQSKSQLRVPLQNCDSSERVPKPPNYYGSLSEAFRSRASEATSKLKVFRKNIKSSSKDHWNLFQITLRNVPGRPPLQAHLSKHFRMNFGNVSKPSTRSVGTKDCSLTAHRNINVTQPHVTSCQHHTDAQMSCWFTDCPVWQNKSVSLYFHPIGTQIYQLQWRCSKLKSNHLPFARGSKK
jgi:hypothetical protein